MHLNNIKSSQNPALIFFIGFIAYNLFGLVNFGYFNKSDFDDYYAWVIFIVGFLGGLAGLLLGNRLVFRKYKYVYREYKYNVKVAKVLLLIFFVFSICISLLMMLMSGGITLFQGEEARNFLNPLLFNLYRCFPYVFVIYYFIEKQRNRKVSKFYFILLFIYAFFSLLGGYRTQIVEIVLFLFIYLFMFEWDRKKSISYSVLSFFVISLLGSIFSMIRIGVDYDPIQFYQNINLKFFDDHSYLVPFIGIISMFRYSQYTVSSIIKNLEDSYLHGQLFLSNYLTLLPGEQDAQRTIVGELIGARVVNHKVVSHTPTLQGAFYIDFGYIGVFLGFFLIVFLITVMYKYFKKHNDPVFLCFFIYFVQYCILSIHVGYWDIVFLVFSGTLFLCYLIFGLYKIKIKTYY